MAPTPLYSSPSVALPPQELSCTPLMALMRPERVTVTTALPSSAVIVSAAMETVTGSGSSSSIIVTDTGFTFSPMAQPSPGFLSISRI